MVVELPADAELATGADVGGHEAAALLALQGGDGRVEVPDVLDGEGRDAAQRERGSGQDGHGGEALGNGHVRSNEAAPAPVTVGHLPGRPPA
ncbi:hypothetical protein [Kitasatospora aureofaciens]|uniref:hypothetical protein n=1 Tax=Kitasatospora aureofaciens TaxID=1894 RepID=UPI0033CE3570